MKVVTHLLRGTGTSKRQALADLLLTSLMTSLCLSLFGCSDRVRLSSPEQLAEFQNAGPLRRVVDTNRLVWAKIGGGPYRVVPGDALELTMPSVLQVACEKQLKDAERTAPYICRVTDSGMIALPLVGEIEVEGKSRGEIEAAVINAYYPKLSATRPSVFVRVLEYATAKVSISGAIQKPGVYSLRNDQMSLAALLMEAQGIVQEGAACIRIDRADRFEPHDETPSTDRGGQASEALSKIMGTGITEPLARHTDLDKTGPQTVFRQSTGSGKTAELTVTYGENTALAEQLEIAREIKKWALLDRLIQRDPRVPVALVNQRLSVLAERFNSGCVLGYREYASTSASQRLIENPERMASGRVLATRAASSGRLTAGRTHPLAANMQGSFGTVPVSQNSTKQISSAKSERTGSIVLPVEGLNIPFADVALQDGDAVVVERLVQPHITVMGLVNSPGTFPYPPGVQYNLMNVLGLAGGLSPEAEPRYATIYREKQDHTIAEARFKLVDDFKMTEALNVQIRPGDIVAIEHTPRTRTNVLVNNLIRFNFGAFVPLADL